MLYGCEIRNSRPITEFLAVASALRNDLATKALEEKPNITTVDLTAKRLRVQVVGAPHVQQLATEVARQVMYLMAVQREARADAEGHKVGHAAQQTEDNRRKLDLLTESVRDASTEVIIHIGRFVHAIRSDLGTAGADKAEISARTTSNTAAT